MVSRSVSGGIIPASRPAFSNENGVIEKCVHRVCIHPRIENEKLQSKREQLPPPAGLAATTPPIGDARAILSPRHAHRVLPLLVLVLSVGSGWRFCVTKCLHV